MAVSPSSSSSSWSTLLETGSGIALLPEVEFVTIVVEVEGNKPTVVAVTVLDPDVDTGCIEILGGDAGVIPLLLDGDTEVFSKCTLRKVSIDGLWVCP